MSKYDKTPKKTVDSTSRKQDGLLVEGSYQCQNPKCGEVVENAFYHRRDQVLAWVCSSDHRSYIEEFLL